MRAVSACADVLSEVMLRRAAGISANTEILVSTKPESIHDVLVTNRHIDTTGWIWKVAFT
jgi:hypothetical protein